MSEILRNELLKLHRADFGPEEEQAVLAALRGGWLTRGPLTQRFEEAFGQRVAAPHCLGVNSCTAALHLALLAAGIGPGDEVIVPALTFAASANVVVHCGATPVFADVLPTTHCIDPAHAESLVTPRTRGIVAVHFAGVPADLGALHQLAQRQGLFVLEDCAHAIEAMYRGRPVGVAGGSRFAAYSFYATKNLICGEGGMLACAQGEDRARAALLGLHGMSADAWKRYSGADFKLYDIVAAGYKYNMFDLQAALGLVQLDKLAANWELRRAHVARYGALLAQAFADGEFSAQGCTPEGVSAHHLYILRLNQSLPGIRRAAGAPDAAAAPHSSPWRDALIHALRRRNVEAYVHYICLPETAFYRERYGTRGEDTPVAADLSRRSVTMPLFPTMTDGDIEYAVAMLRAAYDEAIEGAA